MANFDHHDDFDQGDHEDHFSMFKMSEALPQMDMTPPLPSNQQEPLDQLRLAAEDGDYYGVCNKLKECEEHDISFGTIFNACLRFSLKGLVTTLQAADASDQLHTMDVINSLSLSKLVALNYLDVYQRLHVVIVMRGAGVWSLEEIRHALSLVNEHTCNASLVLQMLEQLERGTYNVSMQVCDMVFDADPPREPLLYYSTSMGK